MDIVYGTVQWMVIGIAIIAAIAVVELVFNKTKYHKNSFMTEREKRFYWTLSNNLKRNGLRFIIAPQVAMSALIGVKAKQGSRRFWKAFNKIGQKRFDYVLIDSQSLEPLLVVELQDSSHKKRERAASDLEKEKICKQADVPLMQIWEANERACEEIIGRLAKRGQNNEG